MKVPNEIRQMYTDAYNMLVDVYKEEDDLNLGGEARMNFPGTMTDCNWTWRSNASCMAQELSDKLYNSMLAQNGDGNN